MRGFMGMECRCIRDMVTKSNTRWKAKHRVSDNLYRRINMKRANARNYGHEVKGYIIANGMTLTGMAAQLAEKYGWSSCMQNLSGKLRRGTFSYTEAVEIADILGYDIVWKKRKC